MSFLLSTVVQNVSLLLGEDLQLVNGSYICIDDGRIVGVGEEKSRTPSDDGEILLDGSGLLAIPGLVDAHVHLGDSFAKDVGVGTGLDDLVHPTRGLKTKLLNGAKEAELCEAISSTSSDMIASGITTFADFREGGLVGVQLAIKALQKSRQRAIILGRPNWHFNEKEVIQQAKRLSSDCAQELTRTVDICAGIGISGPNEYTDASMKQIHNLVEPKDKLLATHAAESLESNKFSIESFSVSEVERALQYLKPDFLVHATNSTQEDLRQLGAAKVPVVCCPRANAILGVGCPPILQLLHAGVTVALGTDNVMLNAPNMFREMDYTSKMLRATHRNPGVIDSREILKMATVNAARVLRLDSEIGSLEEGKRADILFLDWNSPNLRFSKDLVGSIVHRARQDDVKCVMVDGEIAYGSLSTL